MKKHIVPILILLGLILGCSGIKKTQISPEAQARESFARNRTDDTPFRVSFHAEGTDKEILDIVVLEEVAPYAAIGATSLIVTDDLKKQAKLLKFTKIKIKGGRKSFFDGDSIDRTYNLK